MVSWANYGTLINAVGTYMYVIFLQKKSLLIITVVYE